MVKSKGSSVVVTGEDSTVFHDVDVESRPLKALSTTHTTSGEGQHDGTQTPNPAAPLGNIDDEAVELVRVYITWKQFQYWFSLCIDGVLDGFLSLSFFRNW
jgi:hypothetical protein